MTSYCRYHLLTILSFVFSLSPFKVNKHWPNNMKYSLRLPRHGYSVLNHYNVKWEGIVRNLAPGFLLLLLGELIQWCSMLLSERLRTGFMRCHPFIVNDIKRWIEKNMEDINRQSNDRESEATYFYILVAENKSRRGLFAHNLPSCWPL